MRKGIIKTIHDSAGAVVYIKAYRKSLIFAVFVLKKDICHYLEYGR